MGELASDIAIVEAKMLAFQLYQVPVLLETLEQQFRRAVRFLEEYRGMPDFMQQAEREKYEMPVAPAVLANGSSGNAAAHAVTPVAAQVEHFRRHRGEAADTQRAQHQVVQLHETDQADGLVEIVAVARKAEVIAASHPHDSHRKRRVLLDHGHEVVDPGIGPQQQLSNRQIDLRHGDQLRYVADEFSCSLHTAFPWG